MFDCHNLLHPFQHDPGTSQRQRIIDQLLSDSVKIDGRSMADLLDYFLKLSTGINYYDKELNISDWQPFFKDSVPFLLASISKYDHATITDKSAFYKLLFTKEPSASGLQLLIHFIYYNTINKIYTWQDTLHDSQLPLTTTMEELIRSKLAPVLKKFIARANAATKWFGVKKIDFTKFLDTADSDTWNLRLANLYAIDETFQQGAIGKCGQMKILYENIMVLLPSFLEGIKLLAEPARENISSSLLPLGNELKEKHSPHLALVFTFIRLFQKMQDELNKKTKDHLKYFYTEVLRLKPAEAEPDKANIVFEVQKIFQDQYQKYRIEKGTLLNGGRDNNNSDILFTTDDEIVVNETQVAEVRTLFLHNEQAGDKTILEGVYMAPKADKADGVEKDFSDDDPKNWYTLGNKFSKFTPPGKKERQQYPAARLGFALASPVLYLAEGKRTVTITLACEMDQPCTGKDYPSFLPVQTLYKKVRKLVKKNFYVITEDMVQAAVEKGIGAAVITGLRNFLPDLTAAGCYSTTPLKKSSVIITENKWRNEFFNALPDQNTKDAIAEIFKKHSVFKLWFSGAEEWISPARVKIKMFPLNPATGQFILRVKATLDAGMPAVTFFNKENLKEDIGTDMPVVKIELDNELKILRGFDLGEQHCCLERPISNEKKDISFYHFFRGVKINQALNTENTRIDVKVCGLKNFIVQNDENVMDVNSVIFPFGTRPKTGANFYISSKEVFCKNWTEIGVRFSWKDLPPSLETYYHGYEDFLTGIVKTDFNENNYFYIPSFLQNGIWLPYLPTKKKLFDSDAQTFCTPTATGEKYYHLDKTNFNSAVYTRPLPSAFNKEVFTNSSRDYFLKLGLFDNHGLAFHHSRYSYILARQMMALGKWPQVYVGPVYDGIPNPPTPGNLPLLDIDEVFNTIIRAYQFSTNIRNRSEGVLNSIEGAFIPPPPLAFNFSANQLKAILQDPLPPLINRLPDPPTILNPYPPLIIPVPDNAPVLDQFMLSSVITGLEDNVLKPVYKKLEDLKDKRVVIPNEPYTPQIQGMSLDYKAVAKINDIDLIHLYPFDNTYKPEKIELRPNLFPSFCDEGALFIALKDLQPGNNLNLLFQLAEATADSEVKQQDIHWYYLDNNIWKDLRPGFEILEDGTIGLTSTGIIKLALPGNMTTTHSIMPANMYWIRAAIRSNSSTVSETISIIAQAISATFRVDAANDKSRLDKPLEKGSIAKLLEPDPAIKTVDQPAESFGGRLAELDGSYYLRVSELLRHKGRAIQKWDYERLVLEKFPQIYRAKCINHSFHTDAHLYENDVPCAPGYIILALVPDLNKLKAGNSFEPKVPVSLLEKIEVYLKKIVSPFVRLKAANPRYERIHFCITIRLVHGKDENYYKEKLKSDLQEFLAPWAIGKYDKLAFGQCVYRSDVLRFLEKTDYIDFIRELKMSHENDPGPPVDQQNVCPVSPRSVLVAGNIDVRIDPDVCETWCKTPENQNECAGPELVKDYCKTTKPDVGIIN